MIRKIGGWYRIGIVLSIIWVLLVSGIAIYECFRDRTSGRLGLVDDVGIYSVFGMSISQAFVEVTILTADNESFKGDIFKNKVKSRNWKEITSDPEFQAFRLPLKQNIFNNYFAENIESDPEFQALANDRKINIKRNMASVAALPISEPAPTPSQDGYTGTGRAGNAKSKSEYSKGKDKFGKPNYKITFKIKNFLCVLFLPILGMWGLVLGIVLAVLWIKEGFKKQ